MHIERSVTIEAPAKINLTLDVLGVRADGYHEVRMIMQTVSLFDTIRLEARASGVTLTVDGNDALETDDRNLAYRAAKCFLEKQKIAGGVHIRLTKRIPMAAGLAGGSTDAAAVIKGLVYIYRPTLDRRDVLEMCAEIGSDVPFCYEGGTMLATGRGEVLERLPDVPRFYVILSKPNVSVSTAWVYGEIDAAHALPHPDTDTMVRAIHQQDGNAIKKHLGNVLEVVTIGAHPEIQCIKECMEAHGARALMSGSGPTVFGLVEERSTAERLWKKLQQTFPASEHFLAWTISGQPMETTDMM